ncbi:hypothetical protein BDY19DRAFT_954985 [Irpex rosettiformis]|uniref:Uncharacterized protein n=1 Tax=Irpex rosettiformis TaxID=378272 RepID=A0ACB8TYZ1_9APHY|nr:hypothetical protein BDY19DRAFT_954985 [Irpex rosettiformis]
MATSIANRCPSELVSLICAHIYEAGLAPSATETCLDPLYPSADNIPTSRPSSYPAAHWSEQAVRRTLANACLVNHVWYDAAKPWLWHKVEVRLPRSWMALVEELVGGDDEPVDYEDTALFVNRTIQEVEDAAAAAQSLMEGRKGGVDDLVRELHGKLLASLSDVNGVHIPPELLSPPATRDPSPRRLRAKSKSPGRWKLMRSISDAMQNVVGQEHPGVYIPSPQDPHPGRLIHHLDFTHFRTIGMRRSLEEGVTGRFVTPERLLAILKGMPYLLAFGGTEYMDGALTTSVLQELLLRGSHSYGRGRPSRGRGLFIVDHSDPEEEDRERRRDYVELKALDLTGCISAVFTKAMQEFVTAHLLPQPSEDQDSDAEDLRERSRVRFSTPPDEPLVFAGIRRLGLRGMKSIQTQYLQPFVLAFPFLTHLDLSCTRITPEALEALGASTTMHLKSLALDRCDRLTSESIRQFLVESPVTTGLEELSLYGDSTFPSPLTEDDMEALFSTAPCFKSGRLQYLDISSTPVNKYILLQVCAPQTKLRSLGLSYIRNIELSTIAEFLKTKASNVEILTLVMTSADLGYGPNTVSHRQATVALHTEFIRPVCTPPFSFSLSSLSSKSKPAQPPTRLRVIELAPQMLTSLGGGAGSWRIVRSKGSRGWYVDSASGWIAEAGEEAEGDKPVLRRDLEKDHPWRQEIERLADLNGNVSSGVGWHARKMEILHGHGLLGREEGLYGAVAFAYQG